MSHPHRPTDVGLNRTGIQTSPFDSRDIIDAANEAIPTANTEPRDLHRMHDELNQEAPPVGSMPPPATLKGLSKSVVAALKGDRANVFLDKLGERLAFERSGARLYEALLSKLTAAHPHDTGITREQVQEIHDDELRHMGIVIQAIESMGADPTVMTTSADVMGVASMGLVQVLTDSRTTLTQCLEAILIAELADTDAWTLLVKLADGLGLGDMANMFKLCQFQEEIHLATVRTWLERSLAGQLGIEIQPSVNPF